MSKPSSYDLLVKIDCKVDSLREELVPQIKENSDDIVELKLYQSNLMGKIGVGVLVVGAIVSSFITLLIEWIKKRI